MSGQRDGVVPTPRSYRVDGLSTHLARDTRNKVSNRGGRR
jgi:hypothetical protein